MLGTDARVDGYFRDCSRPGLFRLLLEIRAGDGTTVRGDPELLGNDRGGTGVVAGDHHRTDTGALGSGYGVSGLRTRRIDHANQACEHEIPFDALVRVGGVVRCKHAIR